MSKVLVSSSLLSGGVGNGRGAGGGAEGGGWGRGDNWVAIPSSLYDYSRCKGWEKNEDLANVCTYGHKNCHELVPLYNCVYAGTEVQNWDDRVCCSWE